VAALSERFDAALVWAARRHLTQQRHNTRTPYVSHLLATCAVVLEEGGDEELAIAALLHDALEDQPGGRAELTELFGAGVAAVVDDCTDADFADRAGRDWRGRKEAHVRRMAGFDDRSLLVIAADKVCSLQSLMDDLVRFGPGLFEHSAQTAAELLWSYRQVLAVLADRLGDRAVTHRLARLVDDFGRAVEGEGPAVSGP
jgi:(p)ppGpp synthase/HD superfamily hydrolase